MMVHSTENVISLETKLQRYKIIKQQLNDSLIIFKANRTGLFYELFGEDAKKAGQLLHLPLFKRTKGNSIPYLFLGKRDMEKLQSHPSIHYHIFDYPTRNIDGQQFGLLDLEKVKQAQIQQRLIVLKNLRETEAKHLYRSL